MVSSRIGLCRFLIILFFLFPFSFSLETFSQTFADDQPVLQALEYDNDWDDILEDQEEGGFFPFACLKATARQIAQVNQGNAKVQEFLQACALETGSSPWCRQLTRPNPSSSSVFQCTYGTSQAHMLIHPDVRTWQNAFQAVRLVEELEAKGIKICLIYNWWRPEPYNSNVGGAPGRHPYGTSVDVRFCSMNDMERAFSQLCKWRKQGRLRAIGYYGTTGLHFGMGDSVGNTWGKNCP